MFEGDNRAVFVLGPVAVATNQRTEGVDLAVTYGDPNFYKLGHHRGRCTRTFGCVPAFNALLRYRQAAPHSRPSQHWLSFTQNGPCRGSFLIVASNSRAYLARTGRSDKVFLAIQAIIDRTDLHNFYSLVRGRRALEKASVDRAVRLHRQSFRGHGLRSPALARSHGCFGQVQSMMSRWAWLPPKEFATYLAGWRISTASS